MATNYTVNPNDDRLKQVNSNEAAELKEADAVFDKLVSDSDSAYKTQIDGYETFGKEQANIQNKKTAFNIEKIEQQIEQADKDYVKEQSAAYGDWKKQSDRYGVNAEKMATAGLSGTGYSESSQVSMYNAYQNRVAIARDTHEKAVLNYRNAIQEATLQNNSLLAEIALDTFIKQSELSIQHLANNQNLLLQKVAQKEAIRTRSQTAYYNTLNNIYREMELAEDARQHEETLAENKRQHEETLAENKRQYDKSLEFSEKEHKLNSDKFDFEKDKYEKELDLMKLLERDDEAAASASYNLATAGINNGATTTSSTGNVYEKRNLKSIGLNGQSDETITALIESGALTPYRVGDVTKLKWNDTVLASVKKENRLTSITETKNLLISKAKTARAKTEQSNKKQTSSNQFAFKGRAGWDY